MTKDEAVAAVRQARLDHQCTWKDLAASIGRPDGWTVAALAGQFPLTAQEADTITTRLRLGSEVAAALCTQPMRGGLGQAVPVDPTIYRLYEVVQIFGSSIKELIHEEFGDGIMSAINFRFSVDRAPDPAGDRVVITLDGKFLPYQW